MMLQRGIVVSHETVRQWCAKFGQAYANGLRRRRVRPGDKWHLDEVFVTINGTVHYLWRAVDQHGNVLDILAPSAGQAIPGGVASIQERSASAPAAATTARSPCATVLSGHGAA